jgi:hypothetical protein
VSAEVAAGIGVRSSVSSVCPFVSSGAAPAPTKTVAADASMDEGSSSVNVLPTPGSLLTWISPPRRRAISRLIDRPRPVPP